MSMRRTVIEEQGCIGRRRRTGHETVVSVASGTVWRRSGHDGHLRTNSSYFGRHRRLVLKVAQSVAAIISIDISGHTILGK